MCKEYTPTVHPADQFDPHEDAKTLHTAMNGFGTNEEDIIKILTRRGIEQRIKITDEFKKWYGKDLIEELKSELGGNFEDVIVALMTPLPQYYAKELHDAISGWKTDDETIIEILATASNIETIAEFYERDFGRTLESDLKGDNHFKRLCVSLVQGNRNEDQTIDEEAADDDATVMHEADEECKITEILVTRSFSQLRQIFQKYEKLSGNKIATVIKRKFSGSVEKGFLAFAKCVKSTTDFIVERLYTSMHGLGTNDKTLIRIIVSRSEIDLGDIKEAFEERYGESLESWIKGDTSGDYRRALLEIVRE